MAHLSRTFALRIIAPDLCSTDNTPLAVPWCIVNAIASCFHVKPAGLSFSNANAFCWLFNSLPVRRLIKALSLLVSVPDQPAVPAYGTYG